MTPEEREAVRLRSLEQANVVRVYRRDLKRHLAAGHVSLAEILRSENPMLRSMKLRDLLLVLPGFGDVRVRRVFAALRLSPTIPLANLNPRRREELLAYLVASHPSTKRRIV